MKDLIKILCESQKWEAPEDIGDELAFIVDGRAVTLALFPAEHRIYVFAEAALGQMNLNAFVKFGRYAFSWAVGSSLSIGLHPTSDNVALVGCDMKNIGNLTGDAEELHFAMRRIVSAAQSFEELFSVRAAQGNPNAGGNTARDRMIRQITADQA